MSDELSTAQDKPGMSKSLQQYTSARVSLGQVGPAIPMREQLRFQLDHALARDAVHAQLDVTAILQGLHQRQMECVALRSAITAEPGHDRQLYLRRPDLGRTLHPESRESLLQTSANLIKAPDVVFVIADGLSALAVERHALHLLRAVLPLISGWRLAPVCVVEQGRVAVGDAIGEALQAPLAVMLIGERPGLSSPDSLGVYITWEPRRGRKDAERNCISNIREEGLGYAAAAGRLHYYMHEASRRHLTGLGLKDPIEDIAGLL